MDLRFFDSTALLRKLLSIKIYFDFSNAQNDKHLCHFDDRRNLNYSYYKLRDSSISLSLQSE